MTIIIGFVLAIMAIVMAFSFMTKTEGGKLSLPYDHAIVIDDRANMLEYDEEQSLEKYLKEFQDKTGVTVCVVTRNFIDRYMGYDCEKEAYNCYVERWDDEKHWLIYYVGDALDRSDDWEWNLMCGDDCVGVLSRAEENAFTNNFHRYLVASSRYSFEECIVSALSELKIDTASKWIYREDVIINDVNRGGEPVDKFMIIFFVVFFAVGAILIVAAIVVAVKKPSGEALAKMNAYVTPNPIAPVQEDTCEYCGGIYVVGTVLSCPHCAAPLKAHNSIQYPGSY